jgi:diguanylate cyclase (GGDEF)-like protein
MESRIGSGGSFIVDRAGTILGFSAEMEKLTGWPAATVVGRSKDLARSIEDRRGGASWTAFPLYEGDIEAGAVPKRVELSFGCRDGQSVGVEALATRIAGREGQILVNVLRVLTRSGPPLGQSGADRRDALTGLVGRNALAARLAAHFETGEAIRPVALVLADVDHLHRVNDQIGRSAGDDVLRKLAGILRATVGPQDLVARLGEDEFAALLTDAGRGEARQIAARLRSTVERFHFFGTREAAGPRVTLSLGAASYPADAESPDDLLGRAREALQEARSLGRNRVWCYTRRPRVPVHTPVYFDSNDPVLLGYARDISPSGIFIETRNPIDIGMRCALAFPLPSTDARVHVVGRVVRTVPEPSFLDEGRVPGMGVEFERFGSHDRRAIEAFLFRHEGESLRPETGILSL